MDLSIDSRMIACSGIGTMLKNLIGPLSLHPFSTTLIVPPEISHQDRSLRAHCLKPCDASIYSLQEQFALSRLVSRCDLFWSPHYNIPILPIKAKKRIVTINDAYHLAFKHTLGWKERLYAEVMFRMAILRSDGIITLSRFSQEELHRLLGVPKEKIRIIYPGVDFDRFSIQSSSFMRDELRKKYSLPSSFYLFIGNLKPHKNLRLILDAYEQHPIDLPIVVVGKKTKLRQADPSLERIETSVKLKEKVFLVGEILDEELPSFYQMATALIFPSFYEGFGLPPLEAMAAGCPSIVSARASMLEVCGDAPYFIYSDKAEELAEAMFKVVLDLPLRVSLREKGILQAQKFRWSETARQYREFFEEIYTQTN